MIQGLVVVFMIILFVCALIASPLFRIATIVLAVLAGGIFYFGLKWDEENANRYAEEDAAKKAHEEALAADIERRIEQRSKMVKATDLEIRDAELSVPHYRNQR